MTLKELKLTDLETKVVFEMASFDEFDEMSCGDDTEISEATNIDTKKLRGVLSSLSKKGVIYEGEYPNGVTAHYLKNEFNYLKN